jgi:hypothetical protein
MPYEYYLEPENEKRIFPLEVLQGMHNLMNNIPHHKLENGTYVVFKDQKDKDVGLPGLLSAIDSGRGSFIEPFIRIESTKVVLSIVMDSSVDCYLYDFAVWCQKHFPCQLYEGSEAVPLEELLYEEELEIPRID